MFSTHKARAFVIFDMPRPRPHTAAPVVSRVGVKASGMGGPVGVFPVPGGGGCGGTGVPRPTPRWTRGDPRDLSGLMGVTSSVHVSSVRR